MTGKNVLITGCSSGIGRHVAQRLVASGYRVLASARQQKDVQELQQQGLEAIQLDLQSSASIARAVTQIKDWSANNLFALFNNAGYGQPGAVEDLSRETMRQQFETNVFGTLELTNALLPLMRAQGYGRIIFNSSVLGLVALPYRGAYNASKFALEGFADTLRLELRHSGIFVSLIEPGPISSRFRSNAYQQFKDNIQMQSSVHREKYILMEQRFKVKGKAAPFTQHPEAVFKRVRHILRSRRPRPRYYVTLPCYLLAGLKRILPHTLMDRVLAKIGDDELKQKT